MRIGRFQVIEPLTGRGGRVLAAYDPRLDRKVAIELGTVEAGGDEARARRRQQARAMARIGHANVVRVHEVGEHEGEVFVATDFVSGGTLADWCREHPPGTRARFEALLELMIQATRGLAAAHAARVWGLPLGPGDMLVDAGGRLRLRGWTMPDAGSEVAGSEVAGSEVAGSEVAGSEAPGPTEGEAREDLGALCRTLLEAALGVWPLGGAAPDEPAVAARAEVPAWCVAVLRARWSHADALRSALERGRDGRRRRQLAMWLGGVTVVVAGLVLLRPAAPGGCRTPDDAPSRRWAQGREPLEQRFAAAGVDRTHSHALHTMRRLDQLAAQWDAERLEACSAADDDERAEARLRCLDRAAAGFHVVLDELERLEPARMSAGPTLTLSLPELRECREPDPSRSAIDHDSASVREASRRLTEAATLVNLRRGARAEEIVATLEAEGWAGSPGVESRGRLVLANAAYVRGEYERARAQALASLRAAELGDDPREAAAAWAVVGNAELARLRLDEAAFAAERVESLASSVGDVLLLADADVLEAGVELGRGHPDRAVASFELAEHHLRTELGDEHKRLASLYQDLVPALVMSGRLERAVEAGRRSATMLETLVGADSPLTHRAHGVLGLALADFGARDDALEQLGRALEGLLAEPGASPHDRFIFGLKRAELLGLAGRSDEAVAALEQLRPPPGDRDAELQLALTLGTVLLEGGRAAEAAALYEGLLAEPRGHGTRATGINRAVTQANLAIALARVGRAEEAVALVEPTIAAYEALGMPPTRLGSVWLEFVAVYRAAGDSSKSRMAAERGLAALERGGGSPEAVARARAELAALEAELHEPEAAR